MRSFVAALMAALFAGPVLAAEPPAEAPPKTVAPVTVSPRTDPPKVVATYPASGQVAPPGALVMKITFDQKMDETAFALAAPAGARSPNCLKTPRLLSDGKTFVLLCTVAPNSAYAVAVNPTPQAGFANIAGTRAAAAEIAFTTNDSDGPHNIEDALKAASLTVNDSPIATQP